MAVRKYLKKRPAFQRRSISAFAKWSRPIVTPGSSAIGRSQSVSRGGQVFSTKRTVTTGRLAASTTVETDAAYSFQLSDLPNYTEFTLLYDEYRIDKVVMTVIPDTQQTLTTAGQGNCVMWSVLDYDDATALTVLALQQYETCKTHNSIKPFTRTVVPRWAKAVYSGAFTSFSSGSGWIDSASAGVQHYGIKLGIATQQGTSNTYTIVCDYYVSFRKTR